MNESMKKHIITIPLSITLLIILISGCLTVIRQYDEQWNERFSNVESLNKFASTNDGKIDIQNKKLQNYKLKGVQALSFTIKNSFFSNIELIQSSIGTLTIESSEFEYVDFSLSTIDELNIQKSNLLKFICKGCLIKKLIIADSEMIKNNLRILSNLNTVIDHCQINDSYLWDSEIANLNIQNTRFVNGENKKMSYFDGNTINSLFIKNSSLNVEFQESKIRETVLENVSGRYAGFLRISGDRFLVKDSDVEVIVISGTKKMNLFESINSKIEEFGMSGMNVNKIVIKNCYKDAGVWFDSSLIEEIQIDDCDLWRSIFNSAKVNKISIKNSKMDSKSWLYGSWDDMSIDEFIFENVSINGIFEMKNAQIKTLKTTNLKKGKNLTINYEGANFSL
jgi:uncharacterized protein YjbI with pentapeptide repeats